MGAGEIRHGPFGHEFEVMSRVGGHLDFLDRIEVTLFPRLETHAPGNAVQGIGPGLCS